MVRFLFHVSRRLINADEVTVAVIRNFFVKCVFYSPLWKSGKRGVHFAKDSHQQNNNFVDVRRAFQQIFTPSEFLAK